MTPIQGASAEIRELVWRDEAANQLHGESAAVKKFAGILYPHCIAPVEFIEYNQIDANR